MATSGEFLSGVIEGFYGRPWSFELRRAYADFLAASELNTCIYCPKDDAWLRRRWQEPWPQPVYRQLHELAAAYRDRGVYWGVGLSPFELYLHYGRVERDQLRRKLENIGGLQAPLLAVLFDDMPGDLDALAARQAEIVSDICHWCPGIRTLVCPTYYSFDPLLEKHFGRMPDNYWADLGRELPSDVDIFWTGNKVCAESVRVADIHAIEGQLGRPVLLWDNYPVNDGEVRSNSLYLEALTNRDAGLRDCLTGHLCNPMNQGVLSLPALLGLADLYGCSGRARGWVQEKIGATTWRQLRENREEFLHQGLSGMGATRCAELADCYKDLPGPAAAEVVDWLNGEYAWDPACLTG